MAAEFWDTRGRMSIDSETFAVVAVMRDTEAGRVWHHRLPPPDVAIAPGATPPEWPLNEAPLSVFTESE